jgi:TetR/AcrR family transcriptional regulator, ethionamide resistance regulator
LGCGHLTTRALHVVSDSSPRDQHSRNATEESILDAARAALREEPYERITIDGIAKRAFVSRTAVYFYFPNKRAVVNRLIQLAFSDMYAAAEPYLEGDGDPRRDIHRALARTVDSVHQHASVLLLAARLSGQMDRLPAEWEPFIMRLRNAAARRIRRDQQRGLAPSDIPAGMSSRALLAMVEGQIVREVVIGGGDANESVRVLAELWWRAVYSPVPESARPATT